MRIVNRVKKKAVKGVVKIIMAKDEVKITSKTIKNFFSKYVRSQLHKNLGSDIDIQFGDIIITNDDEKAHVELSVSADINSDELIKLLESINME